MQGSTFLAMLLVVIGIVFLVVGLNGRGQKFVAALK